MSKYDLIKDELDSVFKRLAPQAFYERIYKKELQERSAFKDGACNGIMTILNKNNVKNFMIKQDLKVLNVALSRYEKQKKKLESIEKSGKSPAYTERAKSFLDFVIVSSCGYMGKRKCLDMVRECYEICIDLDSLKLNSIQVLKDICDKNILPLPTLITLSGNGIHLHYVFDKPLNVENRHNQSILNEIKRALTYHWWNPYLTDLNDKRAIQYQSIFQSFRMVGTFTKDQRETVGYESGASFSKQDLESFINYKGFKQFAESKGQWHLSDNKVSLEEAKKLYPLWWERVQKRESKDKFIVNKESKSKNPRTAVYEWWLNKLREHNTVVVGHRYYCIYTLAVFAKKCQIDFKILESDAFSFKEQFNFSNAHAFTDDDIQAALTVYKWDKATKLTARHLSEMSGIEFKKRPPPKYSRQIHIAMVNAKNAVINKIKREERERIKAEREAKLDALMLKTQTPKPKRKQKLRARDRAKRESKLKKLKSMF